MLGVTLLVALIAAFTLRQTREALAQAQAQVRVAEARRVHAVATAREAESRLRVARDAVVALGRATPEASKTTKLGKGFAAARDWKAEANAFEAQVKDPKAQVARFAVEKMRLHQKFEPFYRKLGLSAEKIAALEEAEAVYDEKNQDIYYAAIAQQLDNDDPAVKQLYGQAARERTAAEKSILGRPAQAEFAEYRRMLPVQEFVAGFDGLATISGEPLNEAQKQQLMRAVGQAIPDFGTNKKATPNMMEVDWSRVDAAAAAILSPTQLELLQTQDPPGSGQGRFWGTLNKLLNDAKKAETHAAAATATAETP